ncbi:MAG: FliA/WhiG family RNA polymerase sigma factor [Deltaproteobacteria bacterium]|nr:FliA/WhiG family RNA polymerase sigma factor [Deltaproteobacteria bacterium]
MTTHPPTQSDISPEEREEITRSYLPLVKRIASFVSRKAPSSVSIDDLIGAGMLGLVDAASRFDPNRADQFKAFAEARVRGAMIDELRTHGPLSRDLRQRSNELTHAIWMLERKLGRRPDEDEIADELGIEIEKYYNLLVQLRHATVLSPTVVERAMDRPRGYPERVPGNPQDDYLFQELKSRLAGAIAQLSDREQRVLSMYYRDELSLREIGERFNVTESRICQVRSEAVHRLKALFEEEDNG